MSTEVRLSRELRLLDITMIGVGAMIGAGIFVLTGIAAGVAGPALIVAFLLNGIVALLTAMAYAELGSAFHDAGGGYLWVKTSLPDPNGFLSGWMSWFAHAVACSLYALGFGAYFRLVLEAAGAPSLHLGFMTLEKWLAVLTCVVFSYINFRGASETGKAGNVVTVGKIAVIGGFIGLGIWVLAGRPDWQTSFEPFFTTGWGGVFAAMGLTFIAFEGYEIIAQTSEEVENPKRNVPRAIFLSLAIVVPIYLLVAFVAIGAVVAPEGMRVTQFLGQEKEVALVRAADQFLAGGGFVILVGGLLSTLSALNATIYSSSRVAFAMARDANLPTVIGTVHPRRATPHVAIAASALIVIGMAILLPIEDVAAAADIMFLLLFVQVNVAVIRLRKLRPDLDRGFRVPLMPFVPVLAIGTMLFLAVFLFTHYPMAWVAAGGWIAAGAGVYYGYSRKREAAHLKRAEWMERIERKEYRVLVAVSSPRTVESLMEVAVAIATQHKGEVVAVSVVEVPEGEALATGQHRVGELEPVLQRAAEYAQRRGVPVRPVVEIARRVSHGIVEAAREEECNFLVIGRPVAYSFMERVVASIVERVLQDAPCQVGIVYGTVKPDGIGRIVLPVTRGPNPELAAELAPALSRWFEAEVQPVTVVPEGMPEGEATELVAGARATLAAAGIDAGLEVLRRREIARGIAQILRRDDLVLIGAPSASPLAALVGETIPNIIAQRRRVPVLVVREVEQKKARRLERLFFAKGAA
ncbi:MAG: amino acid permease [Gemmatimonadota bacterium]|nr:amino acid permease [Gemmatimonadota bacterium]